MLREFILDRDLGPVRCDIMWSALIYVPPNGKSLETSKRRELGKLVAKFKKVMEKKNEILKDGRAINYWRLKDGDHIIILEQHEIDLIRKMMDEYPHFLAEASDTIYETYDWLGTGAEKKDA